mmetsp:Transcript_7991/g.11920  ORF Transcript_7991/g.11920 Transcript_7991/m.11920 type:complete len:429 (+) Transcript_7991:111-1397(+)|eukprot:CAMPEP_0185024016 /NCGR_PEP_ID=MMETSP1103-20130426/6880_1 /TAXON_ID=36769 /ORGANISM="Paraphysomonas bandaiensis, Strain Caron Lab Isolate" /LENGTH=428 /DNA_ID=CAMNT_0027556851 /DNA_START=69 /DNA_END=1355 /DNA_ORIENTATION=+
MGKGGESTQVPTKKAIHADNVEKTYKLSDLSTEELKKWSKAYGTPVGDRVTMLKELNPLADGILDPYRPANLPLEPPKFTLKTIKDAIPRHCFERNLLTSFSHLFVDLVYIAAMFYASTYISMVPVWARFILWPVYWYAQGSVMTGVWVIAHECGHQSFSDYEWVNNTVGSICHSLLLVPYHSWRITHGKHHNNTGSCENDEVFCPSTRSDWANEMLRETPISQFVGIFLMLTVGWMPGYLIWNATGPAKYRGKNANHFSPTAVFFSESDYWLIVQSDICFFSAVVLLAATIYHFGFVNVWCYYLVPYMVVNYHLVLITYLQHTDVYMPHFRNKEWNWLRGALCTVDRSFGRLLDRTFHHIVDTHVCHHLFSKMPFYHAEEATIHIKKVLGPYYMKDDTSIAHALYRSFSCCQYVEDTGDIVFFKNIK